VFVLIKCCFYSVIL